MKPRTNLKAAATAIAIGGLLWWADRWQAGIAPDTAAAAFALATVVTCLILMIVHDTKNKV